MFRGDQLFDALSHRKRLTLTDKKMILWGLFLFENQKDVCLPIMRDHSEVWLGSTTEILPHLSDCVEIVILVFSSVIVSVRSYCKQKLDAP